MAKPKKQKIELKSAVAIYKKLWKRFLTPHKKLLALAIFCGAVAATMEGFGFPMIAEKVFPIVFGEKPLPPALAGTLEHLVSPENLQIATLIAVALAIPIFIAVRAFASFSNTYFISKIGLKILENLRVAVFEKLQYLPLAYHDKRSRGDLQAQTVYFPQMIQQNTMSVTNDLVIQPLTLIAAAGFLVYQAFSNDGIGLFLVNLLIASCAIPLVRMVGKGILKRMKQMLASLNVIASIISQNLASQRDIKSFNLEEQQTKLLRERIRAMNSALFKISAWRNALVPLIEILSICALTFSLWIGVKGGLSLTNFTAIALALYYCYGPIKHLGKVFNTLQMAGMMLGNVEEILDTKNAMPEPENPAKIDFDEVAGTIDFDNVSFGYDAKKIVLRDVNIHVPAGQIVALVGPSGAGKTTFINLLCRFYDCGNGSISIDGNDVRQISRADRTKLIGLVSQFPVLFRGNIKENIRIGRPNASDDEIAAAGTLAALDDFVNESPDGYKRFVGESGEGLSGGQRQRIAIARAFLKNAPILILDEATAALDNLSEAKIQSALDGLMKNRTTFIIAHRFSTIRRAERILVFNEGRIVADGPHERIYRECALYKTLFDASKGDAGTEGKK